MKTSNPYESTSDELYYVLLFNISPKLTDLIGAVSGFLMEWNHFSQYFVKKFAVSSATVIREIGKLLSMSKKEE